MFVLFKFPFRLNFVINFGVFCALILRHSIRPHNYSIGALDTKSRIGNSGKLTNESEKRKKHQSGFHRNSLAHNVRATYILTSDDHAIFTFVTINFIGSGSFEMYVVRTCVWYKYWARSKVLDETQWKRLGCALTRVRKFDLFELRKRIFIGHLCDST